MPVEGKGRQAVDWPIYVINLDRAGDRLAHAERELAGQGLSFRRVPAVDGGALGPADLARAFDATLSRRTYHVPMQPGEIACFLSHRRAWTTFLAESAAPFAVILEDDFAFRGDLAPVLASLAEAPVGPWDMVKLWGKPRRIARTVAPLAGGFRLTREPVLSKRTVGQIVSRAGAEKLLAGTLPIHRPIDVQLQYPWELDLEILTVAPSLVVDVSIELLDGSTTKGTVDRFDAAKLEREVRRTLLRADLVARSLARYAAGRSAGN